MAADTTTTTTTSSDEVAKDFSPFLKIFKDGRIERLIGIDFVPPSLDLTTGVNSKDVVISPETGVSARIYIPGKTAIVEPKQKLPLLVYFHGGGFCVETPFCAKYHSCLNALVAEANVVAVSIDYRLAPENPIPICYDDSWEAIKWVASHVDGKGSEEWLNKYADFSRVFFAGDSAGGNISHHMAIRIGTEGLPGLKLVGIALVHPYFWGVEPVGAEPHEPEKRARAEAIWRFASPTTNGSDDPFINPGKDPNLRKLGCEKVVVFVAEKDGLRERGFYYKELLEESEWRGGVVEVVEAKEEGHVFHLQNLAGENAVALHKKLSSFINQDN